MLGPVRYSAANAAARARLAHLLPAELWPAILAAASLEQLVNLLGQSAYQSTLASLFPDGWQTLPPEQVEQALRVYLARSFRAPLKLMQGAPRRLLDWLWRRFELDNLKTLLRAVSAGAPADETHAALIPLGRASALPWTALSKAASVAEVAERLPATYHGAFYARTLAPALERYQREGQLYLLEIALDLAYYRKLLRLLGKLGGRDWREARRLIGSRIDGQNVLWAFRYRVYFNLSPEEILNYTLQRRLRADAALVRQVALGASLPAVVNQLWGKRLPGMERLTGLSPAQALPKFELIFRRYLHNLALDRLRGYPFHLGVILAYTILLESETRDLLAVIEGQRAGWPADQIRAHLIGARGQK